MSELEVIQTGETERRTVSLAFKLTPKRRNTLLEKLRSGVDLPHAAAACGVTERTVLRWVERGKEALHNEDEIAIEDLPYARLVLAIREEIANQQVAALEQMQEHGQTQWQATAWWLERTDPDQFGRRYRMEVGNANNEPLKVQVDGLDGASLETLKELRKSLQRLHDEHEVIEVDDAEEVVE